MLEGEAYVIAIRISDTNKPPKVRPPARMTEKQKARPDKSGRAFCFGNAFENWVA
jgi:hypothetical protein